MKGTALIRVVDPQAKRAILESLEANGMADLLVQPDPKRPKYRTMPEELRRELAAAYWRNGWPVPKRLRPETESE